MLNFVQFQKLLPFQEAMCNYNKTQVSPYDPTKLAIHSILRPEEDLISIWCQNFKNPNSFEDIVQFIDEENIVTFVDFDRGIISTLKLLQKLDRSPENGINFQILWKKQVHSRQQST